MSDAPKNVSGMDRLIREEFGSREAMETFLDEQDAAERAARIAAYDTAPDDFAAAWAYLQSHPIFCGADRFEHRFPHVLDIDVVKVDPATEKITDTAADTATRVWLEVGPTYLRSEDEPAGRNADVWRYADPQDDVFAHVHDPDLDCGGPTFEAAIVELADFVAKVYGHDRSLVHDRAARHDRAPELVYVLDQENASS